MPKPYDFHDEPGFELTQDERIMNTRPETLPEDVAEEDLTPGDGELLALSYRATRGCEKVTVEVQEIDGVRHVSYVH